MATGVWFLYEARLRIRAIRSRAHRLFERSHYTEPGSEWQVKLNGVGHGAISENNKEIHHRSGSYKSQK